MSRIEEITAVPGDVASISNSGSRFGMASCGVPSMRGLVSRSRKVERARLAIIARVLPWRSNQNCAAPETSDRLAL